MIVRVEFYLDPLLIQENSHLLIDETELHQLMAKVADKILGQYYQMDDSMKIMDVNGNSIGTVEVIRG